MAERRISWAWLSVAAHVGLAAVVSGCGGGRDDLSRKLARMERQLTAVQADHDRLAERVEAVELSAVVTARAVEHEREARADREQRPPLKVIRLEPDGSEETRPPATPAPSEAAAPPDADSAPRPVIRGQGDRVIKIGDDEASDPSSDGSAARRQLDAGPSLALSAHGR